MFTEAVERLLNRNLPASPRARELCAELDGQRVALEVDGFNLRLVLYSSVDRLHVSRETASAEVTRDSCDATLRGTPLNLLALIGPDPEGVIRRGDVQIEGDAEVVQRFRDLGRLLRPDIEEEMSRLVGDAVAHRITGVAAGFLDFGRRLVDTGTRNVAEFLAHERADLVPRGEADAFFADVDKLREDLDRLAARIDLLAAAPERNVVAQP